MSQQPVDSLIHAQWIIPVNTTNQVLSNHAIAVKDGLIVDILDSERAEQSYQPEQSYQLTSQALIPGLINAHGHAAMTLFRGLADDLPLMDWLNNHIWPAESRWVSEDFVATGTELAIAEMLLKGITCFSDMYFFPDIVAKVAHRHKIRTQIVMPILEFPSVWAADAGEYIHKGLSVHDNYRNNELIKVGFGPHAPYTISDSSLERVRMLADELDACVQIHLHETAHEVKESMDERGQRPLQRLEQLGLLSPRLQCVHMTQVTDQDITLLKDNGCPVIHCPESNLKLASGFCPVSQLLEADINVCLGTDGAASNNDLDVLGEAKTAALLAKGISGDATALPAYQALKMATLNGARALGIDHITGSLETGKQADITAIDLSNLEHMPLFDPVSQIIYTNSANRVSNVWINGELLVDRGNLTRIDTQALKQRVERWREDIHKHN